LSKKVNYADGSKNEKAIANCNRTTEPTEQYDLAGIRKDLCIFTSFSSTVHGHGHVIA
jgi:hypothetical protein